MLKRSVILTIATILLSGIIILWGQATDTDVKEKTNTNKTSQKENQAAKIKVTFIELGSVRCIPCKKMMPVMKAIEKEYGNQVKVVFHDVWTSQGAPYAKKYKIRLIPTQIFLDETGKEYFRHEGFFPKNELVKVLKQKGVK